MTALQPKEEDIKIVSFLEKISEEVSYRFFGKKLYLSIKPRFEKNLGFMSLNDTLFFGPKIFSLTPTQIVIETFHEMVHRENEKRGNKDVGTNCYHNKHFLKECVQRGFFVIKHRNQGWSLLSLLPPRNVVEINSLKNPEKVTNTEASKAVNEIVEEICWKDFYNCRSSIPSKREYTYKYTCSCPSPFNSIRSGRGPTSMNPPKMVCMVCGQMFTPAE
jgi:hypothetical protein